MPFRVALARAIALAAVASALLATPVAAIPPDRAPSVSEPFVSEDCGFAVDVAIPKQNVTMTTFFDQAGNVSRLRFSGQLHLEFTNPANGTTIRLSASGPVVLDFARDRFLALGTGAGPSAQGGIVVGHGQVTLDGTLVHGTTVDLCPLLA
jgi:hypothetical protein